MVIVRNQKLIKRSSSIGRVSGFLAIAILGVGMYLTIKQPEQIVYSLLALIAGFTLSQVGVYYFTVSEFCPVPHMIDFNLEINDSEDNEWFDSFSVQVE